MFSWWWHLTGAHGFAGLVVCVAAPIFLLIVVLAIGDSIRDVVRATRREAQGADQGATAESKDLQDPPT